VRLDSAALKVHVDAVSADVEFTGQANDSSIETVSGDVQIRGVGGPRARRKPCPARSAWKAPRRWTMQRQQCFRRHRNPPARWPRVAASTRESMSGDVRVRLPADTSAKLEAKSFSGTLRSDFGTVDKPEHGPGSDLDARLGSADGDISLETFSGDVTVQHE
jgi:DUF4097 and DUF4098 domain-containing protein YvlB